MSRPYCLAVPALGHWLVLPVRKGPGNSFPSFLRIRAIGATPDLRGATTTNAIGEFRRRSAVSQCLRAPALAELLGDPRP